jgi:RHS repeat-associated protein
VTYWKGAVVLSETDIAVPDGEQFGQQRVYNNKVTFDGFCGYNWFINQLPLAEASTKFGSSVAIIFNPQRRHLFTKLGSTYTPAYPRMLHVSLVEDTIAQTLTFSRHSNGTVETTVLNSLSASDAPGQFVSSTDSRGVTTMVTSRTGIQINEVQRSYTVGSNTITDSLVYTYYSSGLAVGRMQYITYRRRTGSGPWNYVSQVVYGYYGDSDSNGSVNDLQSVTKQMPDGLGGWNTIAVMYYRYYLSGATNGFAHGLKLQFGSEAYRRMFNAGIDLSTASDATVKPYADHYFEYDSSSHSVTLEIAAVCPSCPGGGTTTDIFEYIDNPHSPAHDYNNWQVKTIQTLPDDSQIIVYSNFVGQVMLKVNIDSSGSNEWCTFYRYNSLGLPTWEAHPSAVNGYDDSYDDLMNYDSGTGLYQYLNNDLGLITLTEYYRTTDLTIGQVNGYVWRNKIKQGQSGAPVITGSYTYTSNTDSFGVTVYPIATRVQHPDASNPDIKIATHYHYKWHAGVNIVSSITTKLPVVPGSQNGSDISVSVVEKYDIYGQLTSTTDGRGIVNNYYYEDILSLKTRQVLNHQSGVSEPGVNVAADYTYDLQGRLIKTVGPSHTVDLEGTATVVRPVIWNVYIQSTQPASGTWGLDQSILGRGYSIIGATHRLINPVSIINNDKNGRTTDRIASKRSTGSGALSPTDTFVQTDWQAWTSKQYDDQGRTTSQRVYFLIPPSGDGTVETNYAETEYGYDALERQNRVVAPGGTITRTVWTAPQRVASIWVGTDDTGATDSSPAGSGSPNNMVQVTLNQYDNGNDGGDGNLTQVTQYASSSDTRVTTYGYDWRDRKISMDGEVDVYEVYTYDNLENIVGTQRYDTSSSGNLIGQTAINYDNRGRIYQQITYAVDPSTGIVGNALTSNTWYDSSGNVIQQINQGVGQMFSKTVYNGVGWITDRYIGYNTSGTSYSQAMTVADDIIVNQVENAFDEVGDLISVATYNRLNDATGTGALIPQSEGTQPEARVAYIANWFDGIGRLIGAANYGAISSFTRPDTISTRSDTILVITMSYDDAGEHSETTNPAGLMNQIAHDNAGRKTQVVESYGSADARTTQYSYTLDNLVATITAVNSDTGNQVTTYTYGTTLTLSGVARNDLLQYLDYPDSTSSSDRKTFTYNRQGQQKSITDQRGTQRSFIYDGLGRLTDDCVTLIGSATDSLVLRISTTYEVRGMVETVSSCETPVPGIGTIYNQVKMDYNSFSQLITEWQDHTGAVTTSSVKVQYSYADGSSSSNQIRLTGITYPTGSTVLSYDYGTSGGMDDYLSRVSAIKQSSTALAAYTYLGQSTVIRIDYAEAGIRLDLWGGTSGTLTGLDQFNRIIDQNWSTISSGTSIDAYQYGYDQDSNRLWRANTTATGMDEYYVCDSLNRLTQMQRGTLNGTKTGITGTPALEQDWGLDKTGNWNTYQNLGSGSTTLDQSRTHNKVNKITAISSTPSWVTPPAYDVAGNLTGFASLAAPDTEQLGSYDAWNRFTEVDNSSGASDPLVKYYYDGLNRRIKQTGYSGGTAGNPEHFYFSSNWQLLEERSGSGGTTVEQYAYGIRYIDELVCANLAGTRMYVCQDANYNITSLIDTSGLVLEHYNYTPYGVQSVYDGSWTSRSSSSYAWQFGHQGLFIDDATELYYNRNRWIHPLLGRFLTRDPIGYVHGLNLYEYEDSNPLIMQDPTGLVPGGADDGGGLSPPFGGLPWQGGWQPNQQNIMCEINKDLTTPDPCPANCDDFCGGADLVCLAGVAAGCVLKYLETGEDPSECYEQGNLGCDAAHGGCEALCSSACE